MAYQVLASTEDLLSTSGWRELLADFATGPTFRPGGGRKRD
jgi:hypothetical protein